MFVRLALAHDSMYPHIEPHMPVSASEDILYFAGFLTVLIIINAALWKITRMGMNRDNRRMTEKRAES